eukprot:TRINITY_DN63086_c0_g1_i1.p1 TRINITY_DN63086_c0_g1~~TRINITY_DN63086_c0_g1_i1.p1  ORF type:complete len:724 (-),score=81.84 TRINITY_DN63086_c0_g1_i1:23-2194(-)
MFPFVWNARFPFVVTSVVGVFLIAAVLVDDDPQDSLISDEKEVNAMMRLAEIALENASLATKGMVTVGESTHTGSGELLSRIQSFEQGREKANNVIQKQHDLISEELDDAVLEFNAIDEVDPEEVVTAGGLRSLDGETQTTELFQEDANAPEGGCHAVEGDMVSCDPKQFSLLESNARSGKRWGGTLWESPGAINYCYESGTPVMTKRSFEAAAQHITNMIPCVGFIEVGVGTTAESCVSGPSIFVKGSDSGCWSFIGAPLPPHLSIVLNLNPTGCAHLGIAAHELSHALGRLHEQARSDRDQYVKIVWENIRDKFKSQFEIFENAGRSDLNAAFATRYEVMSIMHYDSEAFTKSPGLKTIVPVDNSKQVMGNRMGLTKLDAQIMAEMYGCAVGASEKLCTNDPLLCTSEPCVCRQDPVTPIGIIKVVEGKCQRCLVACPAYPSASPNASCGCRLGYGKGYAESGGKRYYYCQSGATPSPVPAPPPAQQSEVSQRCEVYPSGSPGACECESPMSKGNFTSGGMTYFYCSSFCSITPSGCSAESSCNCTDAQVKTVVNASCNRCTSRCPDHPSATPDHSCACPADKSKGNTSFNGATYYFCSAAVAAAAQTAAASPRCADFPSGSAGDCSCAVAKRKGSFMSGGQSYSYCTSMCPQSPECWDNAACTCDSTHNMFQVATNSSCYQCSVRCTDYPSGATGPCICPEAVTKGSFVVNGTEYFYCTV